MKYSLLISYLLGMALIFVKADVDDGSGEFEPGNNDEPLTLAEIRKMGKTFQTSLFGATQTLTPFLNDPQTLGQLNEEIILRKLDSAADRMDKLILLGHLLNEAMTNAEERSNKYGFPLKKPCSAALEKVLHEMPEEKTFENLVMFWDAVRLDMGCILRSLFDVTKEVSIFAGVKDDFDGAKLGGSMEKAEFFIGNMRRAAMLLRGAIRKGVGQLTQKPLTVN